MCPTKPEQAEARRRELAASAVGYQLVLSVLIGAGLGWGFDRLLGSEPYGLLAGLGIGVAAAIGAVVQLYRDEQRRPGDRQKVCPQPPKDQ